MKKFALNYIAPTISILTGFYLVSSGIITFDMLDNFRIIIENNLDKIFLVLALPFLIALFVIVIKSKPDDVLETKAKIISLGVPCIILLLIGAIINVIQVN